MDDFKKRLIGNTSSKPKGLGFDDESNIEEIDEEEVDTIQKDNKKYLSRLKQKAVTDINPASSSSQQPDLYDDVQDETNEYDQDNYRIG